MKPSSGDSQLLGADKGCGHWGAMLGAARVNDFLRQANGSVQAGRDHASSRTDPDNAERLTGIYGSEGWGFESLRARPGQRLVPIMERAVPKSSCSNKCSSCS
jgi:hypothetical protein